MFRQLLVVVQGLIPAKDHEALLCFAVWADTLWLPSYTGAQPMVHGMCADPPHCATDAQFEGMDGLVERMVDALRPAASKSLAGGYMLSIYLFGADRHIPSICLS